MCVCWLVLRVHAACLTPLARAGASGAGEQLSRPKPVIFQNTGALGEAISELQEIVKQVRAPSVELSCVACAHAPA